MTITVAIINHNTCDHLQACLTSLTHEGAAEVIVVDNDSSDGSAAMVEREFPRAALLASDSNLGYGAAANLAIQRSNAPYVLLLNSDTLVHPGSLEALKVYLENHPRAAIVGPRLVNKDGSLQSSCYPFPAPIHAFLEESTINRFIRNVPVLRDRYLRSWRHNRDRVVPWVLGAALAIRRQSFLTVGGFDPSFFMFAEEVDLCYRLQQADWETHFTPSATITHTGGASIRQYRAEMAVAFFHSMVRFYQLHYSELDLVQFVAIMKLLVTARLFRDTIHYHLVEEPGRRAWIHEGIKAWRQILAYRIQDIR